MTVRTRVLAFMAAALAVLLAAVAGLAWLVVVPQVIGAERMRVRDELAWARLLLDEEIAKLEAVTRDYATWDATYVFSETLDPEYVESNLAPTAFDALGIAFAAIADPVRGLVYLGMRDPGEDGPRLPREALAPHLGAASALARPGRTGKPERGFLAIEGALFAAVSYPVLDSDGQGPARGAFLMAKCLDDAAIRHLASVSGIPLRLVHDAAAADGAPAVRFDDETAHARETLRDLYGAPVAQLEIAMPRDLARKVWYASGIFIAAAAVIFILVGAAAYALVDRTLLARLARLDAFVRRLEASGDLSPRTPVAGTGELARLGAHINRLLDRLEADMAARARAQAALEASEARFRAIFEHSPFSIAVSRIPDGLFRAVNPQFEQSTGICADDAVGKTPDELGLTPANVSPATLLERVASGAGIAGVPLEIRLRNGETRVVSLSTAVIDWSGEPSLLAMSFDLTSQQRVETALFEQEEMLRIVIEQTGQVVYDLDVASGRIRWSGAIEALLGFTHDEFQQVDLDRWTGLIHPEDRARALALLDDAMLRIGRYTARYRFARKDGAYIVMEDAGVFLAGLDGRAARMIGAMSDVTARVRAEQSVRESEEKFRTLFHSASDAIFLMDDRIFLDCNPRTAAIFGCRLEDILNTSPARWSPPIQPDGRDSGEKAAGKIRAALDGEPQHFEWTHCRKDGAPFDAEVSLNRLELNGRHYLQAIVRDVTQRKRVEEQLRQAQKMEALGHLAGGVAHDFNNLLQAIAGYGELLRAHLAPPHPGRRLLDEMLAASGRAAALTRQLLAFGRRQVIDPRPIDLGEVLRELLDMLRRLLGAHIELDVRLAGGLPAVVADRNQLEQVVANLCINARDAMPSGGELTIETACVEFAAPQPGRHPAAGAGPYVVLAIRDTGAGIEPAVLERIFEPFFTTKEAARGTGLGLATVHGIVEQHRGWIDVESAPGRGSTFRVYLPAAPQPAREPRPAAPPRGAAGGSETILLAEDDPAVRMLIDEVLRSAGYRTLLAANGVEALEAWRANPAAVDLLLLDVVMPRMGGPEAYGAMRKDRPDIPCLFSSGYADDALHTGFVLDPGVNLIHKPYDAAGLLERVRALLDARPGKA